MKRNTKEKLKSCLAQVFVLGQRFGFDFLPRHFYSEIPNIAQLKATDWWRKEYSLAGLSMLPLDEQLDFIAGILPPDTRDELTKTNAFARACAMNGESGYGRVEADALHGFVKNLRPRRIVQIGCGVSTAICLNAAPADAMPEIVCVEPYPSAFLNAEAQQGRIKLIAKPVQELDPSFVETLEAGDLLFVDSTHTLGPAGEASRIILELLPRLKKGVYAHFHDIWLPYDYISNLLQQPQFFWHESVLLQSFLCFNDHFQIKASLALLHHKRREALAKSLPNYDPAPMRDGLMEEKGDFPTSLYLQRVK